MSGPLGSSQLMYSTGSAGFYEYQIEQSWVDTSNVNNIVSAIKDNTKLIFIESPTNPMMTLSDIKSICDIAHEKDILVAVDNTFMSPYFQRPIELGADFVIHSLSLIHI